ncbi:cation:proton antiporter [Candidatus Saccharibacteria bacterium]|nr:cation:proton antiporter [Candidatus Saccharibacteria bacterium]
MHQEIFTELSIVLVIVAVVSLAMRLFRQPLILGYILTGILVGPLLLDVIHAKEAFDGFSEIGIALLLFIIGLGMNAAVIRSLGKVSIVTAAVIFTVVGGLGVAATLMMGFDLTTALVMGVALFFSSTIVILKVLSDKREISRLHGQIAIGVILVDDIVATLAIVAVTAASNGGLGASDILPMAAKAVGLGLLLFVAGAFVIPKYSKALAKSQELLFIFAIAWGFGIASLFGLLGFSHEVGALFAGVALASLPYAVEMSTRLKPLRDFFVVLFFVTLGERFVFDDLATTLVPAIILSAIVLIGKPLFTMASLGLLGYTKLTSFKAGIHLSQVSEFSIVLVVLAVSTNLIDARAASIMTLVALITIGVSSYLMKYDDQLYRRTHRLLDLFEREKPTERRQKRGLYTAILFGYHHGGHEFLHLFRDMKQRYLVVDYDPEVIEHLESQGVRHAYGDATDTEFLEEINAGHAKFIASTIIDRRVNLLILSYLHRYSTDTTFICHARTYEDALELYERGAAYVILPRFLGSEYITSHIKRHGIDKKTFDAFRAKHIVSIGRAAVSTERT